MQKIFSALLAGTALCQHGNAAALAGEPVGQHALRALEQMNDAYVNLEGDLGAESRQFSLTASAERSQHITHLLNSFGNQTDRVRFYNTFLSGEALGSQWRSRDPRGASGRAVPAWLKQRFSDLGFSTSLHSVSLGLTLDRYSPNVVALWPGYESDDEDVLIVGAHYDSIQLSRGDAVAPGANDDGSGMAMLLQLAEWISANLLRFRCRVVLIAFSAEEYKLRGSRAWAEQAKQLEVPIRAMIQADMIAYNYRQGIDIGMALMNDMTTQWLNDLVRNWTMHYVPELSLSMADSGASDNTEFYLKGFPTIVLGEPKGADIDPENHSSRDVVYRDGFDFNQILAIGKAAFASVCELAELLP